MGIATERVVIEGIPALVWGEATDRAYVFVHGKMSNKAEAEGFAAQAAAKGWQTLSFDLPEHGDRKGGALNPWNGAEDLGIIGDYAKERWGRLSLFACSLGAYLSLLAYPKAGFEKALFQSPILDMGRLVQNMMTWFGVSEEDLKRRGEVPTPMGETLSWEYRDWVGKHPIDSWPIPTSIFYGSRDSLTERGVVDAFTARFGSELCVLEGGEHFMNDDSQRAACGRWLAERV
jgi:uncharacterized protein